MLLLFVFSLYVAAGCNGELILQGPSDSAQVVGGEAVFLCDLTDSLSGLKIVDQAYTITWTFRPLDMDAVSTVLTSIHHGHQKFSSMTPAPEKYHDLQGPNLRVFEVALSDAGWYACTSNLTQHTLGANLMIMDHPKCHNERPDVYFRENISLECTVRFSGIRPPLVDWRFGSLRQNSTTAVENSTMLKEKLVVEASDGIRGHIYHCHVYYPGLKYVECLALPAIQVYTPAQVMTVHVFPVTRYNEFLLGSDILLKCIGRGYPMPTHSWSFTSMKTGKRVEQISVSNQINIEDFSEEQAGVYECHVTNEIIEKSDNEEEGIVHVFDNTYSVNISVAAETSVEVQGQNAAYVVRSSAAQSVPQVADTSMHFSPYAIGAVICAGLAVLLIIVFAFMAMRMKKRERRMKEKIARVHDENLDDQEPTEYSRLKMSWEIPRKDVRLLEQIGQGAFVEVWKGRMRRSPGSTDVMRVIIKKLQGEASDKERHFFTAELEVLKMLPAHANVIRLVGSYTANEPWLMMMELASEGTLQQFLQRHSPGHQQVMIGRGEKPSVSLTKKQTLTSQKLLALAAQVASGLDHLEKFKLIYYRLRSCKILVAKGGICKLSGFGFANEVTDRSVYESNSLPVRWAAPESLQSNIYNVKTDTWSYGIVAWEIFHFGTTPYPTMGPHEVVESVQNGFRMPKPQHCSSELFELLLRCWHTIPEERPSYQEILEVLSLLVIHADVHIDFSSLPDHLLSLDTGDTATF
ncbi:hypothetical protein BsWGS_28674 [Bradybaena similaris]